MKELDLYAACPLCGGEFDQLLVASCDGHALYKPALSAEMVWMRCDDCGHVFRDGHYTAYAWDAVFSGTQECQQVGHEIEEQRVLSARMIDKVLPWKSGGRWLDVGFGNGALLMTAQEYGFEPVGIDLRRENVEIMNAMGIEAYCCQLEALPDDGFDVVSMADVLEHVAYPKEALANARARMNAGGVLFVSMPNMDAPLWRAMDAAGVNPYWGELEHCHNFGRARLCALLDECGFEPVRYGVSERYRACMEVIAVKRAVEG